MDLAERIAYGTFLLGKILAFRQSASGSLGYDIRERLIRTADKLGRGPGHPAIDVKPGRLNRLENHVGRCDDLKPTMHTFHIVIFVQTLLLKKHSFRNERLLLVRMTVV